METWEVGFAKTLKGLENPNPTGITVGKVVQPLPQMKVSVGEEIILEMDDLVLSNRIYQLLLSAGDQVILLPTTSEQKYFALDKVGE